jgi:hypothetical protein
MVDITLASLLDRSNQATLALRASREVTPEVKDLVQGCIDLLVAEDSFTSEARLCRAALQAERALRQPARYRELRLALELLRSALVDLIEEAPYAADVPAVEVLANLVDMLHVPKEDLAGLLGVAPRTLQRWCQGVSAPSGQNEARVRLVAQVANQLRHTFTPTGVVTWFTRPNPMLGVEPVTLLGDPGRYQELLSLARGSRLAP